MYAWDFLSRHDILAEERHGNGNGRASAEATGSTINVLPWQRDANKAHRRVKESGSWNRPILRSYTRLWSHCKNGIIQASRTDEECVGMFARLCSEGSVACAFVFKMEAYQIVWLLVYERNTVVNCEATKYTVNKVNQRGEERRLSKYNSTVLTASHSEPTMNRRANYKPPLWRARRFNLKQPVWVACVASSAQTQTKQVVQRKACERWSHTRVVQRWAMYILL